MEKELFTLPELPSSLPTPFLPIFRWGSCCLIFTFTSSVCEQLFVFFDIALSCPSNYDFWLPRCVIALSCLITPLCHCIVLSDYPVVPLHCLVWLPRCAIVLSCLITPLCHCIVLSDYPVVPLHCLVWLPLCYLQLFLLQFDTKSFERKKQVFLIKKKQVS